LHLHYLQKIPRGVGIRRCQKKADNSWLVNLEFLELTRRKVTRCDVWPEVRTPPRQAAAIVNLGSHRTPDNIDKGRSKILRNLTCKLVHFQTESAVSKFQTSMPDEPKVVAGFQTLCAWLSGSALWRQDSCSTHTDVSRILFFVTLFAVRITRNFY